MVTDAGTDPSSTPPPPPTPPTPPPPGDPRAVGRIVRRPDRGWIGGVCAGIAEHFGIDVTAVRIGAVLLACMGPGVPAYVVAWIFLPRAEGPAPAPGARSHAADDRFAQALGIGLMVVAVSFLWGDWWIFDRGWLLGIGLIAIGLWLLGRGSSGDDTPAVPLPPPVAPVPPVPPAPPTPPAPPVGAPFAAGGPSAAISVEGDTAARGHPDDATRSGAADPTLLDEHPTDPAGGEPPDGGTGTATAALPVPPSPPRPGRGRVVGSVVVGALLVWAGVAALTGVDIQDGLAVGLCILGLGFLVGAFVGGSKALIVPAVVLAVALTAVSVVDIPFEGGVGDRTWTVDSLRDLEDDYELGVGEATLDLSDLRLVAGRTPEVDLHVGIGRLEVIVPAGAAVAVHAEVGAGEIVVVGHRDDGMGVEVSRRIPGDAGSGGLDLDLQVGMGRIEVVEGPRP